jgi:hypothetical protein
LSRSFIMSNRRITGRHMHICAAVPLTINPQISSGQSRESAVFGRSKALSHTSVGQVEKTFTNLSKPLEWRSFLNHGLPILMEISEKVKNVAIENGLNGHKLGL